MFSDLKVKQTQCHNRLGLEKLSKMTKVCLFYCLDSSQAHHSIYQVGSDIKAEQQSIGLTKDRGKRKVHKSVETLLAVPCYSDLLDDQDDEDESERGRLLVSSSEGWHTEMAKWIGEARAAELAEDSSDEGEMEESVVNDRNSRILKWKPITLAVLFGGQKQPPSRLIPAEIDAESALMQALAEAEEDLRPDDGEIEIPSDEEYNG